MIGHPNERRLLGFLDGRTAEGDRQRIARHLADCQRCRDVVQGHRAVRAVFRLEPPSAPGGVLGRILDTRAGGGAVVLPVVDPGAARPGRAGTLALIASAAAILVVAMVQLVPLTPFHAAWQWWSRTVAEFGSSEAGSRPILHRQLMPVPVAKPAVLHPEKLRPMTVRYRYINRGVTDRRPTVDSSGGFSLTRDGVTKDWLLRNLRPGWDREKRLDAGDLTLKEWDYRLGGSALAPATQRVRIAGDWAYVETTITGQLTPGVAALLKPGLDSFRVPDRSGRPWTYGYWSNDLYVKFLAAELRDGWSGSFLWVDIQPTARLRSLDVESFLVDGSAKVTTPAGTFDSWKVRQFTVNGEYPYIFWLRKSDGLMVKQDCGRAIPGCDVRELLSVTYP